MLIQLTTPRIVLDPREHPAHIHIHTLFKADVSEGKVLFTSMKNPEHGTYDTKEIEPAQQLPLNASDGCQAIIYVLPFWQLFREEDRKRNLHLVPFCTAGFKVTATSAFRASPKSYEARSVAFTLAFPVTGGGVIRIGEYDLANPGFDPWMPAPNWYPGQVAELTSSYNRAHKVKGRSANNLLPSGYGFKQLPDGTREIVQEDE